MVRLSSQSIALIQLLLDTLIKSAVILSAAGLLTLSFRKASAASRHLVWSVAMASLLALPILSFVLSSWRIAALPSLATIASADDGARGVVGSNAGVAALAPERNPKSGARLLAGRQPLDIGAEFPASSPVSAGFDVTPVPVAPARSGFDWKIALAMAWLAGVFAVMARLTLGTARVWLLTRQAHRVTESSWIILARTLATRLRLRRRVRIFKTERISMPMTWGLMRSAVLLPKEADHWSMECRWIVMAHELTHVKRRDCLMQALAQLACAIYWFNPLVWIAAWRLRVERELACDDHVLETGARASDYASHLVEIARSFGGANCGSPVAVGMACSHLESRVRSILDPNARRRGVNGLKVALAAVIAAVLTAPLAMLQPWRNAEASARMDHASVNLSNPTSLLFPAKLSNLNNLVQPIEDLKNQDQDQDNKARESEEPQKQIGEGQGTGQGTGQGQGQGAGQGQGKSGELTVEQLVEMKAVGVTPEYIESIRKLGYGELTVKQAIDLRAQGIGEEFIKQARGWTNGNPSIDELVEMKAVGMSAEFINGMKQAGYNNLPFEKLVEMRAVGVDPAFVESMRRAGFDKLTPDELIEMKSMGVNEAFVKEAQGWGFGKLSKDDLIEIKSMGVSPEYARSMKALGFDNLSLKQLIEVKSVGVNAEFIKEMREMGFDKLTLNQLVEMKAVGVTPDYIRKMRAIGLKNVSVNELIELKATGVDKILTREKR